MSHNWLPRRNEITNKISVPLQQPTQLYTLLRLLFRPWRCETKTHSTASTHDISSTHLNQLISLPIYQNPTCLPPTPPTASLRIPLRSSYSPSVPSSIGTLSSRTENIHQERRTASTLPVSLELGLMKLPYFPTLLFQTYINTAQQCRPRARSDPGTASRHVRSCAMLKG